MNTFHLKEVKVYPIKPRHDDMWNFPKSKLLMKGVCRWRTHHWRNLSYALFKAAPMVEPPHRPIRKIARIPPIAISAPTPKLNTWRTSGWHDSKEIPGIRSSGERGPGRKGSGTSPSHERASPSGLMSHHSWAWAEWLLDVWGTILQYRTHRNNTTWFNSLARKYMFVEHIFGYSHLYIYIYYIYIYNIIYIYILKVTTCMHMRSWGSPPGQRWHTRLLLKPTAICTALRI